MFIYIHIALLYHGQPHNTKDFLHTQAQTSNKFSIPYVNPFLLFKYSLLANVGIV